MKKLLLPLIIVFCQVILAQNYSLNRDRWHSMPCKVSDQIGMFFDERYIVNSESLFDSPGISATFVPKSKYVVLLGSKNSDASVTVHDYRVISYGEMKQRSDERWFDIKFTKCRYQPNWAYNGTDAPPESKYGLKTTGLAKISRVTFFRVEDSWAEMKQVYIVHQDNYPSNLELYYCETGDDEFFKYIRELRTDSVKQSIQPFSQSLSKFVYYTNKFELTVTTSETGFYTLRFSGVLEAGNYDLILNTVDLQVRLNAPGDIKIIVTEDELSHMIDVKGADTLSENDIKGVFMNVSVINSQNIIVDAPSYWIPITAIDGQTIYRQ